MDTLTEMVGEFTSEPFGRYTTLINRKNPMTYPRIITKVDTDGDGELGAFATLTDEDIKLILQV